MNRLRKEKLLVARAQEIFNHSSPSVTLRYIGINQDNIDKLYMNFSL